MRPIYEAFNRRDCDALFRDTDPEFAFTYHNVATDAGTRRGRMEVVALVEEYGAAFERLTWEPEEFFAPRDRVVARVSVRSLPRGCGSTSRSGTVRSGRFTVASFSMDIFPTPESALKAAGLSE